MSFNGEPPEKLLVDMKPRRILMSTKGCPNEIYTYVGRSTPHGEELGMAHVGQADPFQASVRFRAKLVGDLGRISLLAS